MTTQMCVTFTWPKGSDEDGSTPLKLSMPASALAERDSEGKTLLSAKMSFVGRPEFTLEATGPGEDEYMVPELIKFIWKYVSSGCLEASLYRSLGCMRRIQVTRAGPMRDPVMGCVCAPNLSR